MNHFSEDKENTHENVSCRPLSVVVGWVHLLITKSPITKRFSYLIPMLRAFLQKNGLTLWPCADLRPEVMEHFGNRYNVPKANQYTDYREMLEKEQPDIVSVATQPEHRAEVVIYAAEHGVKAIYAEKAMAASMEEAAAMVAAVEENKVAFNLGTNRRWHTGFDKMKEIIDSGEIGNLRTLIIYSNGTLFNSASHHFDLILRLNSDALASWITGYLPQGDSVFDGDELRSDPSGGGTIQFENGVTAHALLTPRSSEWEAICDGGTITCWNNGWQWHLRKRQDVPGWRTCQVPETFPEFERASSTANLIKDLVHRVRYWGTDRRRCPVRVCQHRN